MDIKELEETYVWFCQLVDEFDYTKNSIPSTKNFIKCLLFEMLAKTNSCNIDSGKPKK